MQKKITLEDLKEGFERNNVLLEDMHSKMNLMLEHTSSLRELPPKFDKLSKHLEAVDNKVEAIIVGQKNIQQDLKQKLDRKEFESFKLKHAHS